MIEEVEEHLRQWANRVASEISPTGVFLFGSLVYRKGVQFDPLISDIDLLVCMPADLTTAPERAEWIGKLAPLKCGLELGLLQILKRSDATSPISSIVAATSTEIRGDIHKDGAANFFSNNVFRDLLEKTTPDGPVPSSGTALIADPLVCTALRFAQKYRNVFLATSPNGTSRLTKWTGTDPVPKDVMRHAAMAKAVMSNQRIPGEAFDVKIGLDYLTDHLRSEEHTS